MKIKAHMLAFGGGKIREIDIPDNELKERILAGATDPDMTGAQIQEHARDATLDAAFYYGQNDFQPRPFPSVSVGDVIELPDGSLHRVEGCGFTKIEALPK